MKKIFLCLLVIIACTSGVCADNYADARKAYEAKDYAKAAQLFEAAVKEKNDAKSHYGLGITYLRLGRRADAMRPLETAQQKDATLNFAPGSDFAAKKKFFDQRRLGIVGQNFAHSQIERTPIVAARAVANPHARALGKRLGE